MSVCEKPLLNLNFATNNISRQAGLSLLQLLTWLEGDPLLNLTAMPGNYVEEQFWQELLKQANQEQLLPRLNAVFKAHSAQIPPPVLHQFKQSYLHNLMRNLDLAQETLKVVSTLEAVGIDCLVLKGAALSQQLYADIACRSSVDIDLLIKPGQLFQAISLLQEQGYKFRRVSEEARFDVDKPDSFQLATVLQLELTRATATTQYELDLHWQISGTWWLRQLLKLDNWKVFSDTRQLELGESGHSAPVKVLNLENYLVFLIIHATVNHTFSDFSQFVDIDRFLRIYQHELDWSQVVSLLAQYHLNLLAFGILWPLTATVQTPLPAWVLDALKIPRWRKLLLEYWVYRHDPYWLLCAGGTVAPRYIPIVLLLDNFWLTLRGVWLILFPGSKWLNSLYAFKAADNLTSPPSRFVVLVNYQIRYLYQKFKSLLKSI